MKKEKKKSHMPVIYSADFLRTKKGFRMSDGEILNLVQHLYIDEGIRYKKHNEYKNWYINLKLPIHPRLVSEECRKKIREFFINLSYSDDDISIKDIDNAVYIDLSLL